MAIKKKLKNLEQILKIPNEKSIQYNYRPVMKRYGSALSPIARFLFCMYMIENSTQILKVNFFQQL
jgi:hypothetical protein